MPHSSTSAPSLAYVYPVAALGAGGSYGNLDVFARTSRESDLQGLWFARDDTFYAGEMKVTPVIAGVPLQAVTTRFHPAYQRTDYDGGDLAVEKVFFVPQATGYPLEAACTILTLRNRGSAEQTIDVEVDLRWNAVAAAGHLKVPPTAESEKVVASRLEDNLVIAWTVPQRYTQVPGWLPEAPRAVHEARVLGAPIAPLTCRMVAPSRVRLTYRLLVHAGSSETLPIVLTFSPTGLPAARTKWQDLQDCEQVLARTKATVAGQLARCELFTPSALINRGLGWGKVNTFRVMDRYAGGLGFTNDPPQDIVVVRDAAWYALGASYLDADFVEGMWATINDHGVHEGGKLTEFVRCSKVPPPQNDYGLNLNDDTPLWLIATHHHYAVTRGRPWLEATYPAVIAAAEHILAQLRDGLVMCDQEGTNVQGIASWRNIIPGYELNGAVTEINAECAAALRHAAQLAAVMCDPANQQRWGRAAQDLVAAINGRLVDPATGLYALARGLDGVLRTELTADQLFPLIFDVATPDLAARTIDRLTRPDFWTARGMRTVGSGEPEYDPSYGWGLMGGIWPNLTAWACYAFRLSRPELVVAGMERTFAMSELPAPVSGGRIVPGEFPEWFDGDTFESKGMAMSPWMPPTFVWLGLESLAGLTPLAEGPARACLNPNLPADWSWVGGRAIALGAERLAFIFLDGTLHVAGCEVSSDYPVVRYEADVTGTAQVRSNAPWTLALAQDDRIVVFVATHEARTVEVEVGGITQHVALEAQQARRLEFARHPVGTVAP